VEISIKRVAPSPLNC